MSHALVHPSRLKSAGPHTHREGRHLAALRYVPGGEPVPCWKAWQGPAARYSREVLPKFAALVTPAARASALAPSRFALVASLAGVRVIVAGRRAR
ncbi:MAG TPA: hypothetical protein VLV17_01490 [Anaeromyxobacteraceae bacterium]|nr:hypothetical protein [Anaeromyxobacteraceae bacterium]